MTKKSIVHTHAHTHTQKISAGSLNLDGVGLKGDLETSFGSQRFGRQYRRPDRHPFVVDVPGSIFFATRAMPQPNTRYSVVVGESFWRLATYIDSVPSRMEDRIPAKAPHILLHGPSGSGKSYLMAAASALLGFGPASLRPDEFESYLSADYRTVFIGDCKRWLESDDPLTYFRMELLRGLRDVSAPTETDDHHSPEHLGCIMCVESFTRVEQVKHFMDRCCKWVNEYQPDTLFVFFIDQAEELTNKSNSIPFQIIQVLIEVQMPLLVFSVTTPFDAEFPFRTICGTNIGVPYRTTSAEFAKHIELHSLSDKTIPKDPCLLKEFRLWTGGIPNEISELFKLTGAPSVRLAAYRKNVVSRTQQCLLHIVRLDGKQRNVLLIVLFAIILRVPMDMSGEFNLANILSLGSSITNLMLLSCIQSFYHTTDGIVSLSDVPAAISLAAHMALTSPNTLNAVCRNWPSLFENVVQAMVHSKLLCAEAKRRMARFYAHAKLLWGKLEWKFEGYTESNEPIHLKFRQARVVVFAGQIPPTIYFTDAGEHHGVAGNGDFDAVAFIPGRTSYWFFDLLIYIPEDRRLYAITTSAVVGTWLKDLGSRYGPMQIAQQKDEGILQPAILLDQWRDTLKKAGLTRVIVKCCILKTLDLMISAGYNVGRDDVSENGTNDSNITRSQVSQLTKNTETATVPKDND